MVRFMSVLALGAMLAVVGCKSDDGGAEARDSEAQMMSNDACPHCPGTQTANAQGKCPSCGMTAKKG